MKILLTALCVLALTGCAQRGLYQWGGYSNTVYQTYKNPEKSVELRAALEQHVVSVEQAKEVVAPGLYAEIGTMYLQAGDGAKASAFYAKERAAWPESKGLMDAMIANLDRRLKTTATSKAEAP